MESKIEIEKKKTKELLKKTAEKTKIEIIKSGLLLMAFNLDKLEELNKIKIIGEKNECNNKA